METASWQRVKEIFNEAREKPPSDRSGFLATECSDDEALRAEVETLLAADDDAGKFLASPTMDSANDVPRMDPSDVFDLLQRALSGRYSLESELGRGGMGIVYLARDVALDRPVAIKLLPPGQAADPEARERFLREARTAAGLSHPNIVPIHLVEEQDDLVYFVMAFVDGESLGDRVRRAGPLKAADAAKVVQEVAWALAYAHTRGVIHRDIKPDNILIDGGSGRALVTDFGIARVTTTETMSQQGDVLGTLQYMSPEQAAADGTIDGRADLYSLGVTAFFALTGRLPFESPNSVALIAMHITEPAPPLKSVNSAVPARLAEAVDRCLAKDPEARFANGEALAEAIADAQVTRREIAPSVREFLSAARSGVAQMTVLGLLGWLIGNWVQNVPSPLPMEPILWVIWFLVGFAALVPLFAARGVVRAGFDEHDVADAAASSIMARDANVEHTLAQGERARRALRTIWGRLGMLGFSTFGMFVAADYLGSIAGGFRQEGDLFAIIVNSGMAAFGISMALKPDLMIGIVTGRSPELAKLLRKLWSGPLGRAFFRFVGIGLKKTKALPVPEAAPTEVLLGRATTLLFEQLPKDHRNRLGDVQAVIGGLERAAVGLRTRRDELAMAIADVGEPGGAERRGTLLTELRATKAAAEERLATAVVLHVIDLTPKKG